MELNINPLFNALTRPAMIAGVTFEYHIINLIISMCSFIGLSPLYGFIFIPAHLFGWAVCKYDLYFFAICMKKLKLPAMRNFSIWGVRAYEPF